MYLLCRLTVLSVTVAYLRVWNLTTPNLRGNSILSVPFLVLYQFFYTFGCGFLPVVRVYLFLPRVSPTTLSFPDTGYPTTGGHHGILFLVVSSLTFREHIYLPLPFYIHLYTYLASFSRYGALRSAAFTLLNLVEPLNYPYGTVLYLLLHRKVQVLNKNK